MGHEGIDANESIWPAECKKYETPLTKAQSFTSLPSKHMEEVVSGLEKQGTQEKSRFKTKKSRFRAVEYVEIRRKEARKESLMESVRKRSLAEVRR